MEEGGFMKIITLGLIALSTSASLFAQGLVNFANTPPTPVYTQDYNGSSTFSLMSAPPGSFSFGLFLGLPNQNWFFTGIYATNTSVDGLFSGGAVAVPGWAPGATTNYFVAGWSGGPSFDPGWIRGNASPPWFGTSGIGTGVAGNGTSVPALNLFDGGPGTIQIGFNLYNHLVPEPSPTALGGVWMGLILFRRIRRSYRNHQRS
jgi:hypothetical protein